MSKKVYIDFELRYKEAVKNLDEMQKEYEKLEGQVNKYEAAQQKSNEATKEMGGVLDKATGGAVAKFQGLTKTLGMVTTGFKSLRVAIIATGIGALVIAIGAMSAAFTRSEEGQNKFRKIMFVIGTVVGDLIDVFADFGMSIINILSKPQQAWQTLVDAFQKGVKAIKLQTVDRTIAMFTILLGKVTEIFLQIRKKWRQVTFQGTEDIERAMEANEKRMQKAADTIDKANGQIVDGLSAVQNKLTEALQGGDIEAYVKTLDDYQKKLKREAKIAGRIADERARADKIERRLLVERAEADRKRAELLEKSVNKEKFTVEERIAFLQEAAAVDEEITNKEIEAARIRLEAKIAENALGKSTKEDLDEQAQLQANLIMLEQARLTKQKEVTGQIVAFKAEQKAIDDADAAEKKAQDEQDAADELQQEKDLAALKKEIRDAEINTEEEARAMELIKVEEHYAGLKERAIANNLSTEELEDALQTKLAEIRAKFANEDAERDQILTRQKIAATKDALGQMAMLAGKDSAVGKAFAIAQATISGVEGVQNAYSTAQKSPITVLFPAYPVVQAGLAAAVAAKNIAAIKSTNASGGGGGTTVRPPSGGGGGAPAFNIVGQNNTNQLADAIAGQTNEPTRAYVVSSDVSSAQELERNIQEGSSIGG